MAADDNIIDSYQTGQRADRENDRQRRKTGGQEGQTDDVGLACSPVAVKQCCGTLPIDVPRAMNRAALGNNQISHLAWDDSSSAGISDKRFIQPRIARS